MEINFDGKTAMVTGAGRGIGREIVKLLDQCNAHVIAVSKTGTNLESIKSEMPSVDVVQVDLSDWNATREALEPYALNVDFLVNNAAVAKCSPLGQITEEEIDHQYGINVKAIINVTQIVTAGMKQRKCGAIVNISSVAGLVGLRDHLVYGGTKAALDVMTKIMALELGEYNIRVNSVNPGVTWTEMAMVGWSDPARQEWMLRQCPLRRFSQPIEVAQLAVYLLSDRSSMVNAVNVPIDGGVLNVKM